MSIKVMALVWDSSLPAMERLVLLAYADHADHDGYNVYPSLKTIARKTGLDRRSVMRIRKRLESAGIMVATEIKDREPTCFRIVKEAIARDPESLGEDRDPVSLGTLSAFPRDTGSPKSSENRQSDDDGNDDKDAKRISILRGFGIEPPTLNRLAKQLRNVPPEKFDFAADRIRGERMAADDGIGKGAQIRSWSGYAVSVFRELAGVRK